MTQLIECIHCHHTTTIADWASGNRCWHWLKSASLPDDGRVNKHVNPIV